METDNELRVEALRLAVQRNPRLLTQDGKIMAVTATEVAQEAGVLFKFLKGEQQ